MFEWFESDAAIKKVIETDLDQAYEALTRARIYRNNMSRDADILALACRDAEIAYVAACESERMAEDAYKRMKSAATKLYKKNV